MVEFIGYLAGLTAMISFLPQVIKTYRTKKANDLSIQMLLLTLSTNLLYVIYAIFKQLYPIIIMLIIVSCIVTFQIILTIKYTNR